MGSTSTAEGTRFSRTLGWVGALLVAMGCSAAGCGPKDTEKEPVAADPAPPAISAFDTPTPASRTVAALLGQPPPTTGLPAGSLRATSRVLYVAAPDQPHQLTATFVGHDRARVELRLPTGETGERLVETRIVERVGIFDYGHKLWNELEGEERTSALRRLVLRRATLLFPDGVSWEPATDRADGRAGLEYRAQPEPGVVLRATLDAEAGLERVAVLDAAGGEQEALVVRTTTTIGDRLWPHDMELEIGGLRVWQEKVLGVQLGGNFADSYFAPEGEQRGGRNRSVEAVLVDLPRSFVLRRELELAERGWTAARARAVVWLAEAEERAQRGGPVVDPRPAFELDPEGRPVAVLLRQVGALSSPEYLERPAGRGVSLLVGGLEALGPADLERLVAAAGAAAGFRIAGPVEARELGLHGPRGEGSGQGVQLVLPLEPETGDG